MLLVAPLPDPSREAVARVGFGGLWSPYLLGTPMLCFGRGEAKIGVGAQWINSSLKERRRMQIAAFDFISNAEVRNFALR
jgi:hypothetical protein